jgi:xylulokinase
LSNSIGIDLGTSSVKIGLFDEKLRMIDRGREEYAIRYVGKNGAEQSATDWWNAIVKICGQIREKNIAEWNRVGFVGVTGQFSGTIAIDENGNTMRNPIIWLDSRGEEEIKKLISGFPSIAGYRIGRLITWLRLTGGAPAKSGKDSLAHILFLKANEPDVYSDAFKFLEPKDYINFKLTGKVASTYDTMILHWLTDNRDINNIKYDDKLLSIAEVEESKFPKIIGSWEKLGSVSREISSEIGLSEDTVVAGGAGDIQASLIGSGCVENLDPLIYIGTSSWISTHVSFKKTDIFHNLASLPSALPGKYFVPAEQESAGSALDYIRKTISPVGKEIDFNLLDGYANDAPAGSDGLLFIPWLFGERAPVESRSLRGSIYNLSITHQKSHLARSVMEGVALNLRWLSSTFEKFLGARMSRYVIAGGGAVSDIWPQIMADVLQTEIAASNDPVFVNSKGAALLGYLAGGADMQLLKNDIKSTRKLFAPNSDNAELYNKSFRLFLKFYEKNHGLMEKFNEV